MDATQRLAEWKALWTEKHRLAVLESKLRSILRLQEEIEHDVERLADYRVVLQSVREQIKQVEAKQEALVAADLAAIRSV